MNRNKKLNISIKIGILSAIGVILMLFQIPVVPAFPWLQIDLSDIPALIGGFAFGPLAGVIIEALKNVLHILVSGSSTGGVGEIANFLIGVSFVWPASYIYNREKTKKNAIIGMIVGTISIIIMGILANIYILLPLFHISFKGKALLTYILVGIIPMNLLKSILISVITLILYNKLAVAIFKGVKR